MLNNSTRFIFTPTTSGLPDFCILNEEGQLDVKTFSNFMKIPNRHTRKHHEGIFSKFAIKFRLNDLRTASFLDFHLNQRFRRRLFLHFCHECAKDRKPKIPFDSSFECFVFEKINERFFFELNRPTQFDELKNLVEPTFIEKYKLKDRTLIPLLNLWLQIKEDLEKGASNEDLLVAAVFGMASILGHSFFTQATSEHPFLLEKYRYVIKLPENKPGNMPLPSKSKQGAQSPPESSPPSSSTPSLPADISDCTILLQKRVNELTPHSLPLDELANIRDLVAHIQQLAESATSVEIFQQTISAILAYLYELAEAVRLSSAEDEGFKNLIAGNWERYIANNKKSLFTDGGVEDTFLVVSQKTRTAAKKLEKVQDLVLEMQQRIAALVAQTPTTFLERKKREEEIVELEGALVSAKKTLQDRDTALHVAIFPPGTTFENMEENAKKLEEVIGLENESLNNCKATLSNLRAQFLNEPSTAIRQKHIEQEVVPLPEVKNEAPPTNSEFLQSESDLPHADINTSAPVLEAEIKSEAEDESPIEQERDDLSEKHESETGGFESDPSTLKERINGSLKSHGKVNTSELNNLILNCIGKNFLNVAHKAALLDQELLSDPEKLISLELLEAAYFGMNVWSANSRAFEHSQRILNIIDLKKIEGWLALKPMDKATPFLLFCACFQTALWGGNMTLAPSFLNSIKHYFEAEASKLITDLVQYWNKGVTFSLEQLQGVKRGTEPTTASAKISLSDWQDKIIHGTRGWAPLRMALNKCLKTGVFTNVVSAISENDRSALSEVKHFIEEYGNRGKVLELMHKMVAEFTTSKIEANAREAFLRTTDELRDIATQWVSEKMRRKDPHADIQNFASKFPARLEAIVETFVGLYEEGADPKGYLAAKSAESCIRNLLAALRGENSVVWSEDRAHLWFNFPQTLMGGPQNDSEPVARLNWILRFLENDFDLMEMHKNAFADQAYHIAYLLLVTLNERGVDVAAELSEVNKILTEKLRSLKKKKEHIQLAVDTALVSGLLEEDRHEQLISELDYLDDLILRHSLLYDLRNIYEPLEQAGREIDELYAPRIKKLSEDYQALLQTAQTSIGQDVVPTSWQQQMEEAFRNNDVPVIEEMIDALSRAQAEGTRIREDLSGGNQVFADFFQVEENLFEFLNSTRDPRQLCNAANPDGPLQIDFSNKPQALRGAIKAICNLRTTKPPKTISAPYNESIAAILKLLGIKAADSFSSAPSLAKKIQYKIIGGFASFSLRIKNCDAGPPFTDFGQNQSPEINILISHKEWDGQRLIKLFDTELVGKQRFFMISASPLSRAQRNEFAEYCKLNLKTIFLVDPVMIFYLGSLQQVPNSSDAIRNYLRLATPMTYYNTFVGDRQHPPPPEMRYGRLSEINQLIDMNQGAAIAFAGRQLGKSTILNQVQNRFHNPDKKNYAFYFLGDSYFGGLIDESKPEEREKRIWWLIYDKFCETNLLSQKGNLTTDSMRATIKDCLAKQNELRVIVIFDEIDTLLNLDHSNNFAIFRGIRDLVNTSQGRFKFIIGGLQNVKRFEDSPNYPLNQLGRSLPISIMSVSDASKLVKDPIQTYGLQFENPLVPSRILSITNRHPSLIQIFCRALVKHLALNFSGDVGNQIITDSDITRVFENEEVRKLIRQRFEMTLNLDTRYAIIIYSLALEGRGTQPFSAAQVRDASVCWLPEVTKKTDMQIEAILEELVGLGVLRKAAGKGFALRNSNVLMLLGSQHDIEMKLIHEQEKQENDDPLERHDIIKKSGIPSPLTYRDEKQLLGMASAEHDAAGRAGIKTTRKYTVSIVSGSNALGLAQLEDALPNIDDFSLDWSKTAKKYYLKILSDTNVPTLTEFDKRLRHLIAMTQSEPHFILVKISGERSAEVLLSMLDIAHQAQDNFRKNYQPCKVVFVLSPKALWNWLVSRQDVANQERALPHICLGQWKPMGMRVFLNRIGFPNTPERVSTLLEFTEGWYISLHRLSMLKREAPEASTMRKFGARFKKITELTVKESKQFLSHSGVNDVPWAVPLLRKLITEQAGKNFNADTITILVEMENIEGLTEDFTEQALDWLTRLSLVELMPSKDRNQPRMYQLDRAVNSCLKKAYE